MLGACGIGCDEGKAYLRGGNAGKLNLGFFGSLFKSLHSHLIIAEVYALLLFELICKPVDNSLVEIVAAEVVITRRSKNLLNAVAHLND